MPKVVDCKNVKVKKREKKKSIGHEVRATCNSCLGPSSYSLLLTSWGLTIKRHHNETKKGTLNREQATQQ